MTDERLAELFAEGTAPERDAAFGRRVTAEIRRKRLGPRFLVLAMRVLVILMLAVTVFVTARIIGPILRPIAESSPEFMGVPLPLVVGALALGMMLYALRFIGPRLR